MIRRKKRKLHKPPKAKKYPKVARKPTNSNKLSTPKLWSLKKADSHFSKKILERDKICQFPNCKNTKKLTCSHYIGRATKSTRFDEDNCIALCLFHHFFSRDLGFEYQKQTIKKHGYDGQYTIFMKKRLGAIRYEALQQRATQKIKRNKAILAYQLSITI